MLATFARMWNHCASMQPMNSLIRKRWWSPKDESDEFKTFSLTEVLAKVFLGSVNKLLLNYLKTKPWSQRTPAKFLLWCISAKKPIFVNEFPRHRPNRWQRQRIPYPHSARMKDEQGRITKSVISSNCEIFGFYKLKNTPIKQQWMLLMMWLKWSKLVVCGWIDTAWKPWLKSLSETLWERVRLFSIRRSSNGNWSKGSSWMSFISAVKYLNMTIMATLQKTNQV